MMWSITIPTYNASAYLAETLQSVLAQDMGQQKMEIVVVDNCSTDDTVDIVKRVGEGRIKCVVNERNIGMFGNFNKCIELAQGSLVHLLNADDLVNPGFYQQFEQAFEAHPDVYLVSCNADIIDENGHVTGKTTSLQSLTAPSNDVTELLWTNPLVTPTVVVRKEAYTKLGGFDTRFSYIGDWEMWLRVIFFFKGIYLPDVLAQYRVHSQNGTSSLMSAGTGVLDHDILYKKLSELGFPVSQQAILAHMKGISSHYYRLYYYAGNAAGAANMISLYRKYATPLESALLVYRLKARKFLGAVKKKVA
jgi:glycosyltransferase involved in cell wall biosynthesis